MNYNKHFLIVYTPKIPHNYKNKRFLVSPNSLYKYIGVKNANKLLYEAFNSLLTKTTYKLRKCGKLEFYSK